MNKLKIILKICFYLILCIQPGIIYSQSPIRFSHYSDANGLSHYQAWSIFQDSKGVYWIGTTDGLNRFDGGMFTQYFQTKNTAGSICGNVITNSTETKSKQILIGTSTGISIYNSNENSFTTVFTPPDENSNDNLINYVVVDRYGFIWVSFRYQIYVLNQNYQIIKKIDTGFVAGNEIYRLQADSLGNVWFNISGYLHKISSQNNFLIESKINSRNEIYQKTISDFSIGVDNKFYVSEIESKSVRCYNDETKLIFSLTIPPNNDLSLSRIFACKSGKIWVTTKEHGIYRISNRQWDFKGLIHDSENPSSICSNDVKQIFEDSYGNTWFGTDGGLDVIYKELIEIHSYFEFPIQENKKRILLNLTGFQSDSSNIWISTWGNGLCTITRKNQQYSFSSPSNDDKDLFMNDICLLNHELWIGNYHGCYRYNIESQKFRLLKINHGEEITNQQAVFTIYKDSNSNFWLSHTGNNGISFVNSTSEIANNYIQTDTGLSYFPFRNYSALVNFDDSLLLFGYTRSRGLARFNTNKKRFEKLTSTDLEFFNEQVNCLLKDDQFLWIGNNTGITRINLINGTRIQLTRADGLTGNYINTLFKDPKGFIWVGSKRGLSRIDPKSLGIINFNLNGISADYNINSISFNKELNIMECLSDNSYFSFRLPEEKNLILTHKPSVFSWSIAGESLKLNRDKSIQFSEKERVFVISFYCPVNPALGKLHYSYMLKGFDKDWVNAGERQQAIYSTLPSGKYSMVIRASLDGINWVESDQAINVIVDPLFYKSRWFITLSIILPMFILLMILHLRNKARIKNLMYIQEMRNRIAADLHDDIASTLSSISMMSEFASKKVNSDLLSVQGLLNKIGKHSRQLIYEMSDIVWSVNPDHDNIDSLIARMNDFAATILQDKGIEFQLNKSIDKDIILFNPNVRKNIFLIFKEAIHNAVKHADCNDVKIQLAVEENTIKMKIEDNGKGFDKEIQNIGNGLKNMKKRAEQIHAELSIDSILGKGSIIQLVIKLSAIK